MKITDVKTVLLTGPCSKDPYVLSVRKRRSAAFIEIHTDTEFVGVGETYGGYFLRPKDGFCYTEDMSISVANGNYGRSYGSATASFKVGPPPVSIQIDSSGCGSVEIPGEGNFQYKSGTEVQ